MTDAARGHMAALSEFVGALLKLQVPADTADVEQRLALLDALELALSGAFGPALQRPELRVAVTLRESLLKTGGSFQDMLALTDACRDEIQAAARNGENGLALDEAGWLDHAARAAAPVLRYLMLLHGEQREKILSRADDLARLWFLLPATPGSRKPLLERLLHHADGLWRDVDNPALRGQLYRLQALAEVAMRRRQRGKADSRGCGPTAPSGVSPANALRRSLPAHSRARIYWRARRMARGG